MTAKWKVLCLNRATEAVYEIIRSRLPLDFELLTLSTGSDEVLRAAAAEADFFLGGNVTAELIAAAPRLKLIQCQGVGYDKVDLMAATRAGVPVAITPEGTIAGMAEHTILLILSGYRQPACALN